MTSTHYVVSQRGGVWHYSFKGEMTGPFASRQAAVDAATASATEENTPDTEVLVQDSEMRTESVWRRDGIALTEKESEKLAEGLEQQSDA